MNMRVTQTIVGTISKTDEVEAVEMQLYKGDDPVSAIVAFTQALNQSDDCMYRTIDIRLTF